MCLDDDQFLLTDLQPWKCLEAQDEVTESWSLGARKWKFEASYKREEDVGVN